MNQASDTSVGLRNTNGATLLIPFPEAFKPCPIVPDDDEVRVLVLVCGTKLLPRVPTAGAFPSAERTERLGPYALSSRMVPTVPVGATFSPQSGGIAAVCTT